MMGKANNSTFLLHSTRRCPFCIRVRMMLYLKGLEYEVIEEPLRKWTSWMKDWSANANERARVPVLRIRNDQEEEEIYPESNEINLMLDSRYGKKMFTPELQSDAFQEMISWNTWCDDILKPQIDLYKYGENLKLDQVQHVQDSEVLRTMLTTLENALVGKPFLLEGRLTIADIAIIPFIRQIMRTREGEFDFSEFQAIWNWTHSVTDTAWFQEIVMKKDKES